jgi:predicted nuclease with RNAse H fold
MVGSPCAGEEETGMIRVAGLDIGLALQRRTSGVATIIGRHISLGRVRGGAQACAPIISTAPFRVIAIDGPILPAESDLRTLRAVERLFASGYFQRRCKPGFSHVAGTGLQLRACAGSAADRLGVAAILNEMSPPFPRVRPGNIVEAFPNAFLGVCLEERCYSEMPVLRRGRKFDWLYDQWVRRDLVARLPLPAGLGELSELFARTANHEERAAVICALTALLTTCGTFTAVGDHTGGWFFLPPWEVWEPWARDAVEAGCERLNALGANLRIERASRPKS